MRHTVAVADNKGIEYIFRVQVSCKLIFCGLFRREVMEIACLLFLLRRNHDVIFIFCYHFNRSANQRQVPFFNDLLEKGFLYLQNNFISDNATGDNRLNPGCEADRRGFFFNHFECFFPNLFQFHAMTSSFYFFPAAYPQIEGISL